MLCVPSVNKWSLASIQHQQESLIWDTVKKTLFSKNSSIMKQHKMAVMWLWGNAPLWIDSSALICSTCCYLVCPTLSWRSLLCSSPAPICLSALLQWDSFSVSAPVRETQTSVFILLWKGKESMFSEQEGADLYGQKSPPLASNSPVLLQMMTPNLHSMINPKSTVVIG